MELDPITADFPSRNILPEEDEAAHNLDMKSQYVREPTIEMNEDLAASASQKEISRVVLLCGKAASCLEAALKEGHDNHAIGSISLPTLSYLPKDSECSHRTKPIVSSIFRGRHGDVVIVMPEMPVQEQAMAWVDGVFHRLSPGSVIVVGTCPGYRFKGDIDGAEKEKIYSLHTQGSKEYSKSAPPLPLGNLLRGIEAAVMIHCEARNIPASCIVAIEVSQSPRYEFVCEIGEVLMEYMGIVGGLQSDAKQSIKRTTMQKYAASADMSVYV
jgi:hypothetical protein